MEKLLHYIWKHKILPLKALKTSDDREMEIIDPGIINTNQGPDFFNAKIRIGQTIWAGNVEIHLKASDWFRHGHHQDPLYNNTILHIAEQVDCVITTEDGKQPPQLVLEIPQQMQQNYQELIRADAYPRCHRIIPQTDKIKVHMWMDALLVERLKERSQRIIDRVAQLQGDWERAAFVTLCRSFGFGLNGDIFERWAMMVPLQAAGKHRDHLPQIEALFLGIAGLIEEFQPIKKNKEIAEWKREYAFLAHKFDIQQRLHQDDWKFLRTRPRNFPHIRIQQIALLFHTRKAAFSALLEADDLKTLHHSLSVIGTSTNSRNLIIINTVIPLLYAYGMHIQDENLQQKAIRLLEELPPENNYILRQWEACGLKAENAADSQALIQLKKEYCDSKKCLRCRLGYEFLKNIQ